MHGALLVYHTLASFHWHTNISLFWLECRSESDPSWRHARKQRLLWKRQSSLPSRATRTIKARYWQLVLQHRDFILNITRSTNRPHARWRKLEPFFLPSLVGGHGSGFRIFIINFRRVPLRVPVVYTAFYGLDNWAFIETLRERQRESGMFLALSRFAWGLGQDPTRSILFARYIGSATKYRHGLIFENKHLLFSEIASTTE